VGNFIASVPDGPSRWRNQPSPVLPTMKPTGLAAYSSSGTKRREVTLSDAPRFQQLDRR
jgi:hypothetical protein